MAVNIQITGDTAAEALRELAGLAGPLVGAGAPAAVEVAAAATTPKKTSRTKQSEEKATSAAESDPVAGDQPLTEQEDTDEEDGGAPVPTDVELRAKAKDIGTDAKWKAKIRDLITEFEASNITAIPMNKRREFMARLEKLEKEKADE